MAQEQSYLSWMFNALGPLYGILIPLTGFAVFVGACIVVATNRRPGVIAAYLLFLPLPLLIGLFGTVHGMIASFSIVAQAGTAPKPSEMAQGISMSLFSASVGLLVTFPSFLVLAFGLFFRALANKSEGKP